MSSRSLTVNSAGVGSPPAHEESFVRAVDQFVGDPTAVTAFWA